MPFKSDAQRRWMWANKPEMAKEWQAHTPKGKKLPEKVKQATMTAFLDELQKIAALYTKGLSMFHPTAVAASKTLSKLNPSELGQLQNIFRTAGKAAPKKAVPGASLMAAIQKAKQTTGTAVHV